MPEHPQEPIFDCSPIKTLHNVKDSWWFSLTIRNGFLNLRLDLGTALQKYGAVFHVLPDLRVPVKIADPTTGRGSGLFEFGEHIVEFRPCVGVKFAYKIRAALKNLIRALQYTNFHTFAVDFDAPRSRKMVLR
jgi:hypothetical protein